MVTQQTLPSNETITAVAAVAVEQPPNKNTHTDSNRNQINNTTHSHYHHHKQQNQQQETTTETNKNMSNLHASSLTRAPSTTKVKTQKNIPRDYITNAPELAHGRCPRGDGSHPCGPASRAACQSRHPARSERVDATLDIAQNHQHILNEKKRRIRHGGDSKDLTKVEARGYRRKTLW